jgi:biotin carboxyl carrier protein
VKLIATHNDERIEVVVERFGSGYRVRIGEKWIVTDLVDAGVAVRSLRFEDGRQYSLIHHVEGSEHQLTIAGRTIHVDVVDPLAVRRRSGSDEMSGGGVVKALMPGRVSRVSVEKGAVVRKGQPLLVLEAMKMENEIQAPVDGIVDQLFVEAGQTVESGADLIHIATE